MKRWLPVAGLATLLVGLLALVVTGAVRDLIVVPLLYIVWIARLLYESLPQALVWGGFVVLAFFLVGKHVVLRLPPAPDRDPPAASPGRVTTWARLVGPAARDRYTRWRLAQRLSQLALETLAHQARGQPEQLRRRLEDGALDIPPELNAYLRAGQAQYAPRSSPRRWWPPAIPGRRLGAAPAPAPLDLDPEELVQYLEQIMQQSTGES
jgi:hypothetical protein